MPSAIFVGGPKHGHLEALQQLIPDYCVALAETINYAVCIDADPVSPAYKTLRYELISLNVFGVSMAAYKLSDMPTKEAERFLAEELLSDKAKMLIL